MRFGGAWDMTHHPYKTEKGKRPLRESIRNWDADLRAVPCYVKKMNEVTRMRNYSTLFRKLTRRGLSG